MDWNDITRQWKDFGGFAIERWENITDEDLDSISGDRNLLIEKLQNTYGMSREQAEAEINEWAKGLPHDTLKRDV